MERSTMEIVSSVYTAYTLLNPSDRVVVSIDAFAEAYKSNFTALENIENPNAGKGPSEPLTEQKAQDTLAKGMKEAEKTLDDKEKLSTLLEKVKQKMKSMPMVGTVLANVPTMFRLMNSYLKGEYTDLPRKSLIINVSALSYLISPIDLIPDFIPVIGLMDDMAIVSACIKATRKDLDKYLAWREENGLNKEAKDED